MMMNVNKKLVLKLMHKQKTLYFEKLIIFNIKTRQTGKHVSLFLD